MIRKVKFNYFIPRDETTGNIYDISNLLEGLYNSYSQTHFEKKYYEFNYDKAKLNSISKDAAGDNYYCLVFERLRDYNFPIKTKLNEESSPIEVENDEYIGEEVVLLYDCDNHVLMLQRNVNSLSPRAIEAFLRNLINEYGVGTDDVVFVMEIVLDGLIEDRAERMIAKTRKLTIKGGPSFYPDTNLLSGIWETIMGTRNELSAQNIDIEVSISVRDSARSETPYLPNEIAEDFLSLSENNDLKKLVIKGREFEQGGIEEINLLNNKLEDSYPFEITQINRRLNPSSVYEEMKLIYLDRGRSNVLRIQNN